MGGYLFQLSFIADGMLKLGLFSFILGSQVLVFCIWWSYYLASNSNLAVMLYLIWRCCATDLCTFESLIDCVRIHVEMYIVESFPLYRSRVTILNCKDSRIVIFSSASTGMMYDLMSSVSPRSTFWDGSCECFN